MERKRRFYKFYEKEKIAHMMKIEVWLLSEDSQQHMKLKDSGKCLQVMKRNHSYI
jgi:hypothetical protein